MQHLEMKSSNVLHLHFPNGWTVSIIVKNGSGEVAAWNGALEAKHNKDMTEMVAYNANAMTTLAALNIVANR